MTSVRSADYAPAWGRKPALPGFDREYPGRFADLKRALGRTPTRQEIWKKYYQSSSTYRTFQKNLARYPDLRTLT